jgi:hypothetical protein
MEARELRIGNIVLNDGVENTIVGISSELNIVNLKTKQGNIINANIDLIKPVPLTEKLLLKYKFISSSIIGNYIKYTSLFQMFEIWHHKKKNTFLVDNIKNKKRFINYIHELQNIFWILMEEELEIKL